MSRHTTEIAFNLGGGGVETLDNFVAVGPIAYECSRRLDRVIHGLERVGLGRYRVHVGHVCENTLHHGRLTKGLRLFRDVQVSAEKLFIDLDTVYFVFLRGESVKLCGL